MEQPQPMTTWIKHVSRVWRWTRTRKLQAAPLVRNSHLLKDSSCFPLGIQFHKQKKEKKKSQKHIPASLSIHSTFSTFFGVFSSCYLPRKVICIFWVEVTLCCQIKTSTKEGNGLVFSAPSARSPGSVRGREDPWLPSDCCTRSLSDRGPAVWKSSCRTCRILQRPVSPGSRLCLRPADNVEKKYFKSKKIGRAVPLWEMEDNHPPKKICPTAPRTYLHRHQTCWGLLTLIIVMAGSGLLNSSKPPAQPRPAKTLLRLRLPLQEVTPFHSCL